MKKANVTVVVALFDGVLDEVTLFEDPFKGRAYYNDRVGKVFGSEDGYQRSLEDGCPDRLFYIEQAGLK